MAAQALYRKWRPQTFDAVVGQEHVTRTLRNALRSGRIGHAYLFTGPRGTGKTTMARLLAKAVNCLAEAPDDRPCTECTICHALNEGRLLDLIEIDAASNRGIDEIRELRERVGFRPNEARYKVYVIDEVHMLTEPAFNALLKTLEEPPPHVIFVLATTEPHKIPETILSRCQRFDFRRLTVDEIVGRLADLAEREGLQYEPEALTAIARQATGSLRDAESLLDQLIAYSDETITRTKVQAILGTGSLRAVSDLVGRLAAGDVAGGLNAINQAVDEGVAPGQLNRQVVEYLRGLLLLQVGDGDQLLNLAEETLATMRDQAAQMPFRQVMGSVKLFNEAGRALKGSLHPHLPLELAFIEAAALDAARAASPPVGEAHATVSTRPANRSLAEMPSAPAVTAPTASSPAPAAQQNSTRAVEPQVAVDPAPDPDPEAALAPAPEPEATSAPALAPETEAAPSPAPAPETENAPAPALAPETEAVPAPAPTAAGALTVETVRSRWGQILQNIRPRSAALQALLRDSWAERVEGKTVVIGFKHTFHKDKVSETENSRIVEEALEQVLGQLCRVECELVSRQASRPAPVRSPSPSSPGGTAQVREATGALPAAARESAAAERYQAATQDPVIQAAVEELGAQVVDVRDE